VEVVVMSRNSPETGLRIFNSLDHHGLNITRAALTGGESLALYLSAFKVDLFLSKDELDVQAAIDAGIAAARVYDLPPGFEPDTEKVRIAFDYDGVLVSEESEKIYQEKGLDAFLEHEKKNAKEPLPEGPFKKLLTILGELQRQGDPKDPPVRIAVVTARNRPAHERLIRTLRTWGVRVNSAFFMGGVPKDEVLKAFRAHIFFDDQEVHLSPASAVVPAAQVPYRTGSPLGADAVLDTRAQQDGATPPESTP
jgi:5'-nucleotidase